MEQTRSVYIFPIPPVYYNDTVVLMLRATTFQRLFGTYFMRPGKLVFSRHYLNMQGLLRENRQAAEHTAPT